MKQCPICDTSYSVEHTTCSSDGARLLDVEEWPTGTLISNRFRIIEKLGMGGMGSVYKAEHVTLCELRALKVMAPHLSRDPQFIKRFQYEAQKAVRLAGVKNVAQVYDLQQAEDGNWFIVMEYVGGGSLRSLLQQEGRLPVDRALRIAAGIAEGLTEAHAAGIIHRDIKPENVMLGADRSRQEVAKIVDFGIVASKEGSLTLKSTRLLTPQYAAPEQWRGMPAAELDGRADLYALGITLYEMLTGRLPYSAESTEGWMHAHIYTDPPLPSSLNPALAGVAGLDELVLGCLQKDRERRPRNSQHLVEQIDALRGGGNSPTLIETREGQRAPLTSGQRSDVQRMAQRRVTDNEQETLSGFIHSKRLRYAVLAGVAVLLTSLLIWTLHPSEETGTSGEVGEEPSATQPTDTSPLPNYEPAISSALASHFKDPRYKDMSFTVSGGHVNLTGAVPSSEARENAIVIATNVPGVVSVSADSLNVIRRPPPGTPTTGNATVSSNSSRKVEQSSPPASAAKAEVERIARAGVSWLIGKWEHGVQEKQIRVSIEGRMCTAHLVEGAFFESKEGKTGLIWISRSGGNVDEARYCQNREKLVERHREVSINWYATVVLETISEDEVRFIADSPDSENNISLSGGRLRRRGSSEILLTFDEHNLSYVLRREAAP